MRMVYLPTNSLLMALLLLPLCPLVATISEELDSEVRYQEGHTIENDYKLPLPATYIDPRDLPESFSWGNVSGLSYLTRNLNQHLPQYCGSCWAHGALSALADRIKIARNASGDDINLSIQYILNCGSEVAGSCNGGSASGTYEFIKQSVYGAPYDTCQSYLACSSKSKNGFCPYINTSCAPVNICRTCDAFLARFNAHCDPIASFPNVSISEYGTIALNVSAIQAEIFARGPVTAEIHGKALHDYHGGIYSNVTAPTDPTHIVSIVGWGVSPQPHWIVRNSWGEYWGELGWFRILMGQNVLGIENKIAWATPGYYVETACAKDCDRRYVDPSQNIPALKERLRTYRNGAAIQ